VVLGFLWRDVLGSGDVTASQSTARTRHFYDAQQLPDPLNSVKKIEFPMICPECRVSGGLPYIASTQAGRPNIVRIGVRCRECRNEWTCDVEAADRRLTDPD
jgi:hypothetical protein